MHVGFVVTQPGPLPESIEALQDETAGERTRQDEAGGYGVKW